MDDVLALIGDLAEPEVDTLQEWVSDAVDYLKDHALQHLRLCIEKFSYITMDMTFAMVESWERCFVQDVNTQSYTFHIMAKEQNAM